MPETRSFDATALKIEDFVGILRIEPDAEPGRIEVVAEAERFAKLEMEVVDGELRLEDRERRGAGEWKDDLLGLFRAFLGGRGHETGTDTAPSAARVVIRVAPGTSVAIDDFVGSAAIGELNGALHLGMSAGSVDIASAGPATLRIEGAGRLSARRVTGNLDIGVEGAGAIKVEEMQVEDLKIRVSGAGSVRLGGKAEMADVSVSGAGAVRIGHVAQRPYTRLTGAGAIRIENWP